MRQYVWLLVAMSSSALPSSLPEFPANAVWSRDISQASVNANSASMISATGGWGNGNTFQIDQSMHVLHADANTPMVAVVPGTDGYTDGDCESRTNLTFPLPSGGAIEGRSGYSCTGDDCHLLVVKGTKLYESYESNYTGGKLQSGCVVIWDLQKVYPPQGRGEQCTSTDGAGFPIAPLLFNADEVYAAIQQTNGYLPHAIRFILPNPSMAKTTYVHPASHAGAPSGASTKIPYGSRLRLKATFNIDDFTANAAARVVLRTMQHYGIVLSDGGAIALTAESDTYTTHKWAEFGFDEDELYLEQMLVGVQLSDFEVIETGSRIPLTYDCVRVPDDFVFIDSYDF